MRFSTISYIAIALGLGLVSRLSLASPVPCAGCVLVASIKSSSGIANGDAGSSEPMLTVVPSSTAKEEPDCPGCALSRRAGDASAVAAMVVPDCPGCALITTTGNAAKAARSVAAPPIAEGTDSTDCPGCVLPTTT